MSIPNFDPYGILGLSFTCSDIDIKKAYKAASLKHHPDKGGDPVIFTNCAKARDLLLNPEKRRMYDRGGWSAVQHLEQISNQQRKCEAFIINLQVSLEQVYRGDKIPINVKIPGSEEHFDLELELEPRMIDRNLCVENRGIASPDCITGDVIIKVTLKDTQFRIHELDLVMEINMSIADLLGFRLLVPHPSGKKYLIVDKFRPDDNGRMVMHFPEMGFAKGSMIIAIIPDLSDLDNITDDKRQALQKILSSSRVYNSGVAKEDCEDITDKQVKPRHSHGGFSVDGMPQMMGQECQVQ